MVIEISHSIKYGNYKKFKQKSLRFEKAIKKYSSRIHEIVNVPDDIVCLIRPIRGYEVYGEYNFDCSRVEIDPRRIKNNSELFEVLVHELIHAEQHFRGDFNGDHIGFIWKGKRYDQIPEVIKYEEYCNTPWEVEAFERSENVSKRIFTE